MGGMTIWTKNLKAARRSVGYINPIILAHLQVHARVSPHISGVKMRPLELLFYHRHADIYEDLQGQATIDACCDVSYECKN